jgi:hypothetical protein
MGVNAGAAWLEYAFETRPHVLTVLPPKERVIDIENILPEGFDYKGHLNDHSRRLWGDKESAYNWQEFFKYLQSRALNGNAVMLGVMDGWALEACPTYLNFPEEEWMCLRTTTVIERFNQEFNRRTNLLEILAGERFCYTLLAFVSFKMGLTWRSKSIERVPNNQPFLKRLRGNNFIQEN